MIPKIIHYCWFGGNPLPESVQKCIDSWKKYCPDYELKEWNENNFDLNYNIYVHEAYKAEKWAFVADVARLYALVNVGGIYLDTDVELLKSFDAMLTNRAFLGFEAVGQVATAIMGCEKNHPIFVEFLHSYDNNHFLKPNGAFDTTTNVSRLTDIFLRYGLEKIDSIQCVNDCYIYPIEYFSPKDFVSKRINQTTNTIAIHHFDGSWLTDAEKLSMRLYAKYNRFLPSRIASYLARFNTIKKYDGFKAAFKAVFKKLKTKVKKVKSEDNLNEDNEM